ncbi:HAD-IA family hydrolase [Candidatus Saccharibacteria bacterium]|nr:HAD-IA family hydrolase [Candidatus Saccharibacteria bacterium]
MELVKYIRKHGKTHVIFDFDATLFLLVMPWSTWQEEIRKHLIEVDASIWDAYERGELNISTVQNEYVKNHGRVVKNFLAEHSAQFEIENMQEYRPNTDLLQALEELNDVKKYVWSSNARPVIELVLKETKLSKKFDKIVSKQDVELIKPEPDGFYAVYDESVDKSKYLMVGDSSYDRDAARAAGIDFYMTDFFDLTR